MAGSAHDGHDIGKREDALLCAGTKFRPVFHMLFRPEKMDTISGVRPAFCPLTYGQINITADSVRDLGFDYTITYVEVDRFSALQTRGINLNGFSRKGPADRQGFKTSLSEPFLLLVN
jgi:hypothetical protein